MESLNIFAQAVRKGAASSQEEVKRDLASLLRQKSLNDANRFLSDVEVHLADDTFSIAWLSEVKVLFQSSFQLTFGPVLATEAAAAERLALSVRLRNSETKNNAKVFVEASTADLVVVFGISKQIYDYLSNSSGNVSPDQRLWVREFTPVFLQNTLDNKSCLQELTVAATGGDFSAKWEVVEIWLYNWAIPSRISPRRNTRGDGFFEPRYLNYQPAAIHPLVLRILRKSFLSQLNARESQEEIQDFCQWLVDHVFDGELLNDIKLESIFAAGSLILALSQQQGVVIQEVGQLSIPTTALFWGDLSERVLNAIVSNSQQIQNVPPFWKNKQADIRQLLYSCPEWHTAPLLFNLRSRATKLLGEKLEYFKAIVLQEDLKLTEDKFLPDIELSCQNALPEFRPDNPIDIDTPERYEYFKKLDRLNNQIATTSRFETVIQEITTNISTAKTAFKQSLLSPLAEPALLGWGNYYFGDPDCLNMALMTYLQQQISQFSLDSKRIHSDILIRETLANQRKWVVVINGTATNDEQVFASWFKLDMWDGLRGRLACAPDNESDRNVTQYLSQQLPDWLQNPNINPPNNLDLNTIRPTLAELAHLGISLQIGTYQALTDHLENLISSVGLESTLKSFLAAVRIELGLTALAVGIAPSQAFKQLESPKTAFSDWINCSIESSNAWESRAGMNALILLSRIAEGTGDLLINSVIQEAMPAGSRACRLVSLSINQLFSTGSRKGTGLPFAFAAYDLSRYVREATLSINSKILVPVWASQPIPELLERLTNQLGTATRTTLQTMLGEGGIGFKVFLLSLLQIKLDELDWECQFIVQPLRRSTSPQESKLRHNVLLKQIDGLQKAVQFVFCREQLLLVDANEMPKVADEIKPWWQVNYWLALPSNCQNRGLKLVGTVSSALGTTLEELDIPSEIQAIGGLSTQAVVLSILKRQRWLILDSTTDGNNKTYLVEQEPKADYLSVYKSEAYFLLVNWAASFPNNVDASLLSLAASLIATIPMVSEYTPQDIDGRYEEEFPDLSWKDTTNGLQRAINNLKSVEIDYVEALWKQHAGIRADEIISLLRQPLLLNTADYQEQMQAAIAEVREAEADMEVAEFNSLATHFEVLANQMLYDAADVEVQRQSVLEEVSKLNEQIAELDKDVAKIRGSQVRGEIDIKTSYVEIAKNVQKKAMQEAEKVKIARKSILREIELLTKLLETPTPVEVNGTQITAKGQIGAMAYKVEATLIKQLNDKLATARIELQKAKDAESERKKNQKHHKLIAGICRFIGAVIGTVLGGPAAAALGAEILGAIGELAIGVNENKPLEEILIGLIDNGFAIAKTAGVDLEKELNTLGAKGAAELDQFFIQLDSNLGPILDNLPKILDEQLVKDAIVVFDLPEASILTELLEKSYTEFKKDIPNLGQLGATLKSIQYDSPRQFLNQLSNNLFENTKNNAKGIKALSQVIGKKVEDLTEEDRRKATEQFAKLIVTKVGQEAANFRQDTVANWIRNKRESRQWWNEVVHREAENLVIELFPDVQTQADVLRNLESSLINPEIIRGELQVWLNPWQKELDNRISDITKVDRNASPPASAVAAAELSVTYLKNCIESFDKSLLPWLKGEGNTNRNQLLSDLNKIQTEKLPTNDSDLKIAEFDEANANLSEANAKIALDNMELELKRVGKLYQAADLKVSKATLLNKVANLAKLKATTLRNAQDNSLKASENRQQAAQSGVKSKQFNLQAKKALSQAAMQRGSEASRIRGSLSQPALRLPNLTANSTSRLRERYVELLKDAACNYRELLRFYKSAGATDIPTLERKDTWSEALGNWAKEAQTKFNTAIDQDDPQIVEWDLTPEQIAALLSLDGFRVVFASHITESLPLFSMSRALADLKEEQGGLLNSFCKMAFAEAGIHLSDHARAELDGNGPNWRIIDSQTTLIPVTAYEYNNDNKCYTFSHKWNIRSEAATYTAIPQDDMLTVTRRQKPPKAGRSPLPNQYWEKISPDAARTGRLIGVFLDAFIEGTNQKLTESDFTINVNHLGDFWFDRKQVRLLHMAKQLPSSRTIFLHKGVSPEAALQDICNISKNEGDPHPYAVQGTPLSGTTFIRLDARGNQQFSKMKIKFLYKFYSPAS